MVHLRAGLIGNPVAHSLSPAMQNAGIQALGIHATYELWLTNDLEIPGRIAALRGDGVLGANVTVPHKTSVIPFLDYVTETATRIGAVNTIIPGEDGQLTGDNTDAFGWRRSFSEHYSATPHGTAVVLGAGGASRAIIVALQDLGCDDIAIWNRTPDRAELLATEFGIRSIGDDDVSKIASSVGLIVNTTSAGWHGELPIPSDVIGRLAPETIAADLTYTSTPFLTNARARGMRTMDGLGMLFWQGVRSLELWTNRAAPVDVMRRALHDEFARREATGTADPR